MSASNTAWPGRISRTMRATESASETARTASALPMRWIGVSPLSWAAAWASETKGVSHTCMGWTRVASSPVKRKASRVPSSKIE